MKRVNQVSEKRKRNLFAGGLDGPPQLKGHAKFDFPRRRSGKPVGRAKGFARPALQQIRPTGKEGHLKLPLIVRCETARSQDQQI
jgi:hypothetical protein